ncbi:MAG: hypothetical protein U1F14_09280 [Steroidobacteraceae bacterium]
MVVTFVEKLLLVRLYGRLQRLTQEIDKRYTAGVSEGISRAWLSR